MYTTWEHYFPLKQKESENSFKEKLKSVVSNHPSIAQRKKFLEQFGTFKTMDLLETSKKVK